MNAAFSADQILLALAIFFVVLWGPLVAGFLIRKLINHCQRPRENGGSGHPG